MSYWLKSSPMGLPVASVLSYILLVISKCCKTSSLQNVFFKFGNALHACLFKNRYNSTDLGRGLSRLPDFDCDLKSEFSFSIEVRGPAILLKLRIKYQ